MDDLIEFFQTSLKAVADAEKAIPMQAYMKTEMPLYGVTKPERAAILKKYKSKFKEPQSQESYEARVDALWRLPHREEKYLSISIARSHKDFITKDSLHLYEQLIREGAWWDFVDEIAIHLVGPTLQKDRKNIEPTMAEWIQDDDMWIRRAALLSQLTFKKETNQTLLFDFCEKCMAEKEFFIRKAIGWVLREYSRSEPEAVKLWLEEHWGGLSGLTQREASRLLLKNGMQLNL